MDSLTQIVLGAACGEVVLGKKIGNKALLFGAIGGTIPDLDVFTSRWLYVNEIDIMTTHRGFSHSILFSIIGTFVFGCIVYWLYNKGMRKDTTSRKDWIWLFFLSLFTHIILDSFTPYGTQLFAPFSHYRVAFNNISVVDPTYTIPFLICIVVLMFFRRSTSRRKLWLKLGFGISSTYMLLTIINKVYVDYVFENSLNNQNIYFDRYRTQPTIFNNILWYGVAETKTDYYLGFFSHFDKTNRVTDWKVISKENRLLPMNDNDLAKLAWFSDDYYTVRQNENEKEYQYCDLRYPLLDPDDEKSSLFTFRVFKNGARWDMKRGGPDFDENTTISSLFVPMIKRLKGN